MGEATDIAWCDSTFQPWIGCAKVSPGCRSCYAEAFDARFHRRAPTNGAHGIERSTAWGVGAERRMLSEAYWKKPFQWARKAKAAGKRHRVFCASQADVFEDRPDLVAPRARLFKLIEETPELDWLLLSKRPENMIRLAPEAWQRGGPHGAEGGWPFNVWAGCTAEDQTRLDLRWPHLAKVPAVVRFLSCEPLLGPIFLGEPSPAGQPSRRSERQVDWVIVGGESGPGARHYDVEWARAVIRQCKAAGVACFHKQLGDNPIDSYPGPDGRVALAAWYAAGAKCAHKPGEKHLRVLVPGKGEDPEQWPADLRVREWPR